MNNTKDYNAIKWDDFVYYDETSPTFLRWKVERRTGKDYRVLIMTIGDTAGCIDTNGYAVTSFQLKTYKNHRIIWILFHGSIDPELQIDHQDGNRTNNSIINLRLVHKTINLRNQTIYSNNTTGFVGVGLVDNGKVSPFYTANWKDISGKSRQKSFSISKLGDTEAFRLACEYRTRMIEELNADGAGYTDRHGT